MIISQINKNNKGTLYKIKNNINKDISLSINNVSSPFGLEEINDGKVFYIKWNIDKMYEVLDVIETIESNIQDKFNDKILKSNIIRKNNYPIMLNSKINNSINNNIILKSDGDTYTIKEFIKKKSKYNVILIIDKLFVNNTYINYSITIKNIGYAL
tara:strand:+ start:607 stop:1074 length:468 start_codon:yes stop_codon:yes gene_type:complete